jgi:hypothetical protein
MHALESAGSRQGSAGAATSSPRTARREDKTKAWRPKPKKGCFLATQSEEVVENKGSAFSLTPKTNLE